MLHFEGIYRRSREKCRVEVTKTYQHIVSRYFDCSVHDRIASCVCWRRRDIGTLVQLGFAYHELCDFSQALSVYKKVN